MSTKRQPSKQRRQTQNQRQRAALQARRANAAAEARPSGKVGGESSTTSKSSGGATGGSVLSRLRGASATGRTIRTAGPAGSLPVGHRAALSALLAAAAAAVVGSFLIKIPIDRSGEAIRTRPALVVEWSLSALEEVQAAPDAAAADVAAAVDEWSPSGEEPYLQAVWPLSLGVALPVVGAGLAFRTVSRRSPAKVVNRTMYVTLFGTLLAADLLILFLPAVVGVAIAAFQVRKAEVSAATAAAGATDPDRDVIEVAEVADDDDDDDDEVDELIEAEEAEESDELIATELVDDVDEGQRSV